MLYCTYHNTGGASITTFETNQILHGDAYELIKLIPDQSIDLIVTDPPYEIALNKGKSSGHLTRHITNLCDELAEANIVNGIDESILDEFMRIMKKPNIYIWCNKKQVLMYLNYFVSKHGCKFEILCWYKTNPIPLCGGNYLNDKEFCLYFRKGIKLHTTYPSAKTYWISKANVADKKLYDHPTIKALDIIECLILNSSSEGDIVFDSFLGSGTTAVAALKNNRRFLGIEMNEKHIKTSKMRIASIYNNSLLC